MARRKASTSGARALSLTTGANNFQKTLQHVGFTPREEGRQAVQVLIEATNKSQVQDPGPDRVDLFRAALLVQ